MIPILFLASNMPCQTFESKFGLQHARFVAWNPTVKDDCKSNSYSILRGGAELGVGNGMTNFNVGSGIVKDYDYCVSIPGYKPTNTPSPML
ncbi:hypothetical protein F4802DRAFT_583672 [Xylaria palmicola]|nr:hypothetical protein F4802DRAFT_583672 [Xylaria palmicola]